jgi:Holliday junction DNA helicase RuvB
MNYEPRTFDEFIGQEEAKRELVAMLAAKDNQCVLMRGNYGRGKTTLLKIYASYRGHFTYQDVPDVLDPSDEADDGESIRSHIIDEIHLASRFESLYARMGTQTFLFGTTERERLPAPFLSRCVEIVLRDYNHDELCTIVFQKARNEGISIADGAIDIIADRCRGTPRTAIQLLTRTNNLARLESERLDAKFVSRTLDSLQVYENGLIQDDLMYLRLLAEAQGSPVSLNTACAVLNRSIDYIRENIEYFLLYKKYIVITPRGRVLTVSGRYLVDQMEGR